MVLAQLFLTCVGQMIVLWVALLVCELCLDKIKHKNIFLCMKLWFGAIIGGFVKIDKAMRRTSIERFETS